MIDLSFANRYLSWMGLIPIACGTLNLSNDSNYSNVDDSSGSNYVHFYLIAGQ